MNINTEISYIDTANNINTPFPIVETTETNPDNLINLKKNAIFYNASCFTSISVSGYTSEFTVNKIKQEVFEDSNGITIWQYAGILVSNVMPMEVNRYGYRPNGLTATSWGVWTKIKEGGSIQATKLGSNTVGSSTQPIYLSNGYAQPCTTTQGSETQPIYMKNGVFTSTTSTVGSANIPIYLNAGTLTAGNAPIPEITSQYLRITDYESGLYKWNYNSNLTTARQYIYYDGETETNTYTLFVGIYYILIYKNGNYWHWYCVLNNDTANHDIVYGATTTSSGSVSSFTLPLNDRTLTVPSFLAHLSSICSTGSTSVSSQTYYGPASSWAFSNGLKIDTGITQAPKAGQVTTSFSTTFTSKNTFIVLVENCGTGKYSYGWTVEPISSNSFTFTYGNTSGPYAFRWIAIGW